MTAKQQPANGNSTTQTYPAPEKGIGALGYALIQAGVKKTMQQKEGKTP